MDDLIAWLRVQLDQQQAALIAYRDHRAGLTPCVNVEGDDPEQVPFDEHDSCATHLRTAGETEYRDVAYGLAEVEADRLLIDTLLKASAWYAENRSAPAGEIEGLWTALRIRATVYADRPGYLPEWRPLPV